MGDHVEADRLGRLPLHLQKPGDALQECLEVDGALVEAPAPIVAVLESGCSGGRGGLALGRERVRMTLDAQRAHDAAICGNLHRHADDGATHDTEGSVHTTAAP